MTGKKIYDRDFLLGLQNNPKSKKKPENLPDLDVVLKDSNRSRIDPKQFTFNRQPEVLMPPFTKSMSQRGTLPKRNSQQGRAGSKSGKPNAAIHVTISLKDDVKLRETENAWRPARLSTSATLTEDDQKTAVSKTSSSFTPLLLLSLNYSTLDFSSIMKIALKT